MFNRNCLEVLINSKKNDFELIKLKSQFNNFTIEERNYIRVEKVLPHDEVLIIIKIKDYKYEYMDGDEDLSIFVFSKGDSKIYLGINVAYPNAKINFNDSKIKIHEIKNAFVLKIAIAENSGQIKADEIALWYGADPEYFID